MFDDPKKDLKWLEQQLLAQEQSEADFEEEEEGWWEVDQTRTGRSQPKDIFRFLEEDMEEDPVPRRPSGKRRKKRKDKRAGRWIFLVLLGMAALLIWWLL